MKRFTVWTYGICLLEVEDPRPNNETWVFRSYMKHKLTSLTRKPTGIILIEVHCQFVPITHISKVSVQHLYVTVDDFERDEFVVLGTDPTHKEQGCVATVDHLGI